MEVILYRKNKLGVGSWRCWIEGEHVCIAHSQVIGGAEILHREHVPAGLGGRTHAEQLDSRVRSRANRQRDRGYVDTIEEARSNPRTNSLDLPMPMLAKKFHELRNWPGPVMVQPKFDGFRCMATRDGDGDVICYSRQGKLLTALEHVCQLLEPVLPDDGTVLDGEIYMHGVPLQTVASLAKRKQRGTSDLVYHVYDCVMEGAIFRDRHWAVKQITDAVGHPGVLPVPTKLVNTPDEVWDEFSAWRGLGYEGAMVRLPSSMYDSGNRSSGLLKVKAREDAEYRVLDIVPDQIGCGVLILDLGDGRTFRTLAPGSHDQKRRAVQEKDKYVGREVTVEFANLTKDGVPFHCVATRWKEDL